MKEENVPAQTTAIPPWAPCQRPLGCDYPDCECKSKTTARRDIRVGDIALVQARPNYWGTVTWVADHPGGKVSIDPHPGQGVTERKRTIWKDKIIEWAGSRPVAIKEITYAG